MNYKALNPSKYLQAAVDFEAGDLTLKIFRVTLEEMEESAKPGGAAPASGASQGPARKKGVIWFDDHPLGWVMNTTNAFCLSEMFGKDTNAWIGKRATIYATPVLSFGKMEPGIRVRGSPDLAADKSIILKLMKKKPQTIDLKKTGARAKAKEATPLIAFGHQKGLEIHKLTDEELSAAISFGDKKLASASSLEKWFGAITENVAELRAELARRPQPGDVEVPREPAPT